MANRTHIKSDDFGQKEQDANTALLSLDKGLRSASIGEQCEAIVRFPVLFEKYPFPILINSAFMRLADAYRAGNNLIRMCILKVVQESSKHLEKILNVDDLSKRIYSVIHSNDPLARAITLRILGGLASILADQTNVHHTIMVSLDSHDVVEVDAAIFAADCFAKKSRLFSESICEKLGTMTEWLSTPLDIKMKIIPILKHMHHNINTAEKAWELCEMLLKCYPSEEFVHLTLHTMSVLSVEALVHAQQQTEILFGYIENKSRRSIKLVALKDLCLICRKAPQLWTSSFTSRLCMFVSSTKCLPSVNAVLDVFSTLSQSLAVDNLAIEPDSDNHRTIVKLCDHNSRLINSKVISLLTQLTLHQYKHKRQDGTDTKPVEIDDLSLMIQSQLLMEIDNEHHKTIPLKRCLHAVVLLYTQLPLIDSFLLHIIVDLIDSFHGPKREHMTECLAAIGHQNTDLLEPLIPKVLQLMRSAIDSNTHDSSMLYLCTVVLQVSQSTPMPQHIRSLLVGLTQSCDLWLSWKLIRQAMRYCQFQVADDIISYLSKKVSTEQYYFWLSGLHHICTGESHLTNITATNSVESSMKALNCYQQAISALRAAATQTTNLDIHTQYTELRSRLLRLHAQLILSCSTFRKCPPPAVAAALAATNNQEVSRSGQVVQQLIKCASDYDVLHQSITSLYQSCFDADHSSLHNIKLLKDVCSLMNSSILSVVQNHTLQHDLFKHSDNHVSDMSSRKLHDIASEISDTLGALNKQTLTYKHINALSSAACHFLNTSLPFPRYFFQKLQSTTIKLAISPQSNDTLGLSTNCSAQLTVKVEGVIERGQRPSLYRSVCGIVIYVESNLSTKTQSTTDSKNPETTHNSLKQTADPHNDYFTTNFLLSFPVAGKHNVRVTAAVIDEKQSEWSTGPRTEFVVKSVDDSPQTSKTREN